MAHQDDELELAVKDALGEVLNLAAQVAEMQMSEESRDEIYELLDLVAEHYGIERHEVKITADDGDVVETCSYGFEELASAEEPEKPTYISLAVDNSDKKLH